MPELIETLRLDYLLVGKSYGAKKLKNARLIEKIEDMEKLPGEYRETLVSVLDLFSVHP